MLQEHCGISLDTLFSTPMILLIFDVGLPGQGRAVHDRALGRERRRILVDRVGAGQRAVCARLSGLLSDTAELAELELGTVFRHFFRHCSRHAVWLYSARAQPRTHAGEAAGCGTGFV